MELVGRLNLFMQNTSFSHHLVTLTTNELPRNCTRYAFPLYPPPSMCACDSATSTHGGMVGVVGWAIGVLLSFLHPPTWPYSSHMLLIPATTCFPFELFATSCPPACSRSEPPIISFNVTPCSRRPSFLAITCSSLIDFSGPTESNNSRSDASFGTNAFMITADLSDGSGGASPPFFCFFANSSSFEES